MARRNYGYMATIGADTSGLQTSLAQIDSQCRGLDSSLRQVGRSIQDGMNTGADVTEAQAQQLTLLSQRADLARQRLQQLESVQNQMRNALASGQIDNNAMARYTADVQNARNAVARYEQQIQTLRNAQAQAADATNTAARAVNNSADAADNSNNKHLKLIATLGDIINIAERVGRAMVGVVSSAVDATAKNEQLIGGVETLFGEEAAEKIVANANKAFNTVGVSANNYLETVTSFSASLIQSLGGDTEQAVQLADMALTDMSDNANKMGTDLAMIQYSYQSFAKGQFQLLDNLKLGYGGTKAEMERLIADANRLNAEQGKATDYQLENYADIIRAIHDIQENMGIMGTTAAEAAGTVSGSMQAFQAALENLKAGLGTADADIEALLNNVTMNFEGMMTNMMPVIENVLLNIPEALTAVLEVADNYLPMLLESVSSTFTALMASIVDSAPDAAEAVTDVLMALINQVLDMLPDIQTAGMEILFALINGITEKLPELVPVAINTITTLVNGLVDNIDKMIEAAVMLIDTLADELINPENLEKIGESAVQIIDTLYGELKSGLPRITELFQNLCLDISDTLINTDWGGIIGNIVVRILEPFNWLNKQIRLAIDNRMAEFAQITGAEYNSVYNGDINNVPDLIEDWENSVVAVSQGMFNANQQFREYYNTGRDIIEQNNQATKQLEEQADAQATIMNGYAAAARDKALNPYDYGISNEYTSSYEPEIKENTTKLVTSTVEESKEKIKATISETFKAAYDSLRFNLAKGIIDEDTYISQLRALLESSTEYNTTLYTQYWKEVTTAEEKARQEEIKLAEQAEKEKTKALEEAEKERLKLIEEEKKARKKAAEESLKAYKDVQKEVESAADKMSDGALYEMTETTTGTKPIFSDLSVKADEIRQYAADFAKLSQMDNIPPDLLEEIRGMSFKDRKAVVAELLRMSEANRNLYFSDYSDYKAAQAEAAQVEYTNELQTAGQAVHGAVVDMLSPIIDKARSMGEDTAQAYIDGMNRKFGTSGLGNIGGVLHAAVNVTSPTVSNTANNTMVSGNTPINISIAGTNVIKTTLDKLIGMNRLTSGNNLGV